MEESITITIKEHQELLKAERMLRALEGAGVDNWQGYDYAMDLLREIEEEECK